MREIVFDTETTGLSPADGDRLVEIGCVEMFNRVETGRTFHAYFNPGRPMPSEAEAVHGLSATASCPTSRLSPTRCEELLEFIGDSPLVAHNAALRLRLPQPRAAAVRPARGLHDADGRHPGARAPAHPGAKHSLDALCTRFGVDRSQRVKHGALLDAQLLAQVYVELTGGRQIGLALVAELIDESAARRPTRPMRAGRRRVRPPRPHAPTEEELARHAAFLAGSSIRSGTGSTAARLTLEPRRAPKPRRTVIGER